MSPTTYHEKAAIIGSILILLALVGIWWLLQSNHLYVPSIYPEPTATPAPYKCPDGSYATQGLTYCPYG